MKIETVDYKGIKVIAVSGDIDMYSSHTLRNELMRMTDKKAPSLFIDLKGVSYIDSSGIATFVEVLKTMKTYGGRLKLVSIPEAIREIFRFSRLDNVFEIYRNIKDAHNS